MINTHKLHTGKYFVGIGALLVAMLLGIWQVIAPFALGYQPNGAPWTAATKNDVWLGSAVAVVALIGTVGLVLALRQALFAVGALRRAAVAIPDAVPAAAPIAPHDDELDRLLVTLASGLLADLNQRKAEGGSAAGLGNGPGGTPVAGPDGAARFDVGG